MGSAGVCTAPCRLKIKVCGSSPTGKYVQSERARRLGRQSGSEEKPAWESPQERVIRRASRGEPTSTEEGMKHAQRWENRNSVLNFKKKFSTLFNDPERRTRRRMRWTQF